MNPELSLRGMANTGEALPSDTIGEIISLALSDHVTFDQLRAIFGLDADEIKVLLRQHLKRGSYRAWRKRVRSFSERREFYK
jgi:uncharacterized protein (TIGR03643 family)